MAEKYVLELRPVRVGRLISLLRGIQGKSLRAMEKEFGQRGLFIHATTIQAYESGKRFPSLEHSKTLLEAINSMLTLTLRDYVPFYDIEDLNFNDYLQNMLDKEAMYRAINECIDLKNIGLEMLKAFLDCPRPDFASKKTREMANNILETWALSRNIDYKQEMALWLIKDVQKDGIDKGSKSFRSIEELLKYSGPMSLQLGPAIDILFAFSDSISLPMNPSLDLETELQNVAGQFKKLGFKADASSLQRSSKNILK